MQRLILLRHAKAEGRSDSGEDFDRRLTERGRQDAALMGRVLAEAGFRPDLAIVSSAARTRETWAAAAPAFADVAAEFDKRLYHAASGTIRAMVEAAEGRADTLVIVGHNPGLHLCAMELLIEAAASGHEMQRVQSKFPTAAAAAFRFDEAGRPSFDGAWFPSEHGGGSEG
ncbi:MAG TPA: histidine phosphatase family protein [Caulobacteraceae bacterium]|nr:histidine phosphatase family protein [Caulobacteraceae bacterium]